MNLPSNEDKKAWVELGTKAEAHFSMPIFKGGVTVFTNPAKAENKFTHDLFFVQPADLKTVRTPFRTADRYGIPSKTAITLNKKDVDRYREKYPHIVIIFDVEYPDFKSIRYASLREINYLIDVGLAKLHTYINRVDDQSGNAKESYVLDATWLEEMER